MPAISNRGQACPPSPIRKLVPYSDEAKKRGVKVYHLNIGQPDIETPENVLEKIRHMDLKVIEYSHSAGILSYRKKLTEYYKKVGVSVTPDEMIVTTGGSEGILFTLMVCLNPGDEVIYPDPGFPIYKSLIRLAGGIPVPLSILEKNDFRIDLNELESKLTDRTKLLIINTPANPTGGILTPDDIDRIAELLRERSTYVLSDEIYDRIIYEGSTKSIASIPHMKDRTIVLDGFSKAYAMTGWRLGYGIMSKALATEVVNFIVNTNSCCSAFSQVAGIEALNGPQESVDIMRNEFHKRRDIIVNGLNSVKGFSCKKSPGAFYVFPNITDTGKTSAEVANYLLETAGVAVLSGASFGACGEGHLRLSYSTSIENINEALERIHSAMLRL